MNRGRSSESLSSNGSSPPTDFTSDDEISTGGYNMTSNESLNKIARSSLGPIAINQKPSAMNNGYASTSGRHRNSNSTCRQNHHNAFQDHLNVLQHQTRHNHHHQGSSYGNLNSASRLYSSMADDYDDSGEVSSSSAAFISTSRIPDVVSSSRGSREFAVPDIQWDKHCYSGSESRSIQRANWSNQRALSQARGGQSSLRNMENSENFVAQPMLRASGSGNHNNNNNSDDIDDDIVDDENDDAADLFGRIDSSSGHQHQLNLDLSSANPSPISSSSTNLKLNSITTILCARLVECRNLIEAIEFVERNRDLIDNLTRIVTHDAPAFRNYDMTNYQIDYSVKDSFNPNFWLDREPVVTTADGNCQYHAISLSLTGSELYTPEVRLATAVAVIDNREWFDTMLKLIDRGSVLDLVHTIARNYSWGDETTLKAIAVAINRRIFLYTCNIGKKDYELVKSLSKDELLDAFRDKKFRGGTGIHTYADPLIHVNSNNYIMLFHKSEHFIAVLPTNCQQLTLFEPYNPIVPSFN